MKPTTPTETKRTKNRDGLLIPFAVALGASLFFGGTAFAEARATPPVSLSAAKIDLGRIVPEGHAKGAVRVTNRSDRSVRIARTVTSCGCTSVRVPETIPAHGVVDLAVDVDAAGKGAAVHEGVTLVFAGYESRPVEVEGRRRHRSRLPRLLRADQARRRVPNPALIFVPFVPSAIRPMTATSENHEIPQQDPRFHHDPLSHPRTRVLRPGLESLGRRRVDRQGLQLPFER